MRDDVTREENKTAAILLDKDDSIFDMASVRYRYAEGLDVICHKPATIPKKPADIW
jgi:hypothetical protein